MALLQELYPVDGKVQFTAEVHSIYTLTSWYNGQGAQPPLARRGQRGVSSPMSG
jgi:hypothetical protein